MRIDGSLQPVSGGSPPPSGVLSVVARRSLAASAIVAAERLSALWGVTPDVALLRSGLASADEFYQALADACGLPYLVGHIEVASTVRHPAAIRTGIAPLAPNPRGLTHVLAPEGALLAALLEGRDRLAPGLAIATPAALRAGVFAARAGDIARHAAEALPAQRPDESYRDGPTAAQLTFFALTCMIIGAALAIVPEATFQVLSTLLALPFLGLIGIKLAAALEPVSPVPTAAPRRASDRDLPVYTILIPLYREWRVLPKLLSALRALDYPAGKLDVKLIVEEDDRETREALTLNCIPAFAEVIVAPRGEPRTKPRALNVALPLARGSLVVVYDAEDVPDPGQLRLAVATFAGAPLEVACLQARLVIDNTSDGLLPAFFTVDYGTLFDVLNPALARFDLPVPLGGTSNHFRTDILRDLGGWDAWNVTEDADLAIRLAVAGYRVADLPSATLEEAPLTLRAWMAQRTRWMKGFIQVTITHSRNPWRTLRRLGAVRMGGAMAVTLGVVMSSLVYPFFSASVLYGLATGGLLRLDGWADLVTAAIGLATAAGGVLAMTIPGFVAIKRRGWWGLWPFALLMPFYYLLVSIAAWRGLYELALDPDRWNKTEHGLARTSRAAQAALIAGVEDPGPPERAHARH